MAKITIIGAGMMGSAMSIPATDNGHDVHLVGTHLDDEIITSVRETGTHPTMGEPLPPVTAYYLKDWQQAAEGADLIISGVSSFGVEWFASEILPHLPAGVPVLAITKGLIGKGEEIITFPQYLEKQSKPEQNISFLAVGGPCTSYELAQRQQTFVSFCGKDTKALAMAKELFSTDYYHVSLSTDVVGVECAVALKNAYALGVSLAIGQTHLRMGKDAGERYNPQAALFSQSVKETQRLLALFGAGPANISLSAGDLYVTIFGGRTRRLGTLLGEGKTFAEASQLLAGVTLESVAITTEVTKVLRRMEQNGTIDSKDFPLILHVDTLINQGKTVDIPWKAFEEVDFA